MTNLVERENKTMKRILSFLGALAVVLGLAVVNSPAASAAPGFTLSAQACNPTNPGRQYFTVSLTGFTAGVVGTVDPNPPAGFWDDFGPAQFASSSANLNYAYPSDVVGRTWTVRVVQGSFDQTKTITLPACLTAVAAPTVSVVAPTCAAAGSLVDSNATTRYTKAKYRSLNGGATYTQVGDSVDGPGDYYIEYRIIDGSRYAFPDGMDSKYFFDITVLPKKTC